MNIAMAGMVFDLNRLSEYDPTYLGNTPPTVMMIFNGNEITLQGDDAIEFHKCVNFYIDYKIGNRPDSNVEIDRRYADIQRHIVQPA